MAQICKQIQVEVANEVGKLAQLTDRIKDAGVNICCACAWVEGDRGKLTMVTEDHEKALSAIQDTVDSCETGEVVCVSIANRLGALNEIARKLADAGINIKSVYATTGHAEEATIVLTTTDNAKAAEIL